MAEARQLKAGRWRVYLGMNISPVRDPSTGSIMTFTSLAAARRWWAELHPGEGPLREAKKCARCGGYFSSEVAWTVVGGQYYHDAHLPRPFEMRLRA